MVMSLAAVVPAARPAFLARQPHRPAGRPAAGAPQRRRPALAASAATTAGPAAPQHTPPPPPPVVRTDFLVLGSGIAGLTFALRAAQFGTVAIATKAAASAGCTSYAQGGVCAALAPGDSPAAHAADTLRAGDFANDAAAVAAVCGEGPEAVLELAALGARFTTQEAGKEARGGSSSSSSSSSSSPSSPFHLTREGGHSARRVVHAADATGAEVQRALEAAVAANPAITVYEHVTGLDLVLGASPLLSSASPTTRRPCVGADALHTPSGTPVRFVAGATILATGGAGAAFPLTTNPPVATGDGLAMAARAGARLADMEFVQFHPTAFCPLAVGGEGGGSHGGHGSAPPPAPLVLPSQQVFLISEAVRGEGGRLLNDAGERFMGRYDPSRLELAPRDVVARAIEAERAATGARCVWLDVSHLPAASILSHFPTIAARCAAAGVDITAAPIPVAPAQHYMCGGVRAGLHAQTDVPGLFAVGEAARTGLHGANRLASNSLLEGLVFARRAADGDAPDAAPAAAARTARYGASALDAAAAEGPGFRKGAAGTGAVGQWAAGRRAEAAAVLGASAGIVRTRVGLARGAARLAALAADADAVYEAAAGNGNGGEAGRVPGGALSTSSPSGGDPPPPPPPLPLVELRNALAVSRAVVAAGLSRRESRGGHYLADAPPPPARATTGGGGVRRKGGAPAASPPNGPAVSTCLSLGDVAAVCAEAAHSLAGGGVEPEASPTVHTVPGAVASTSSPSRINKKKKKGGAPKSKNPAGASNNVVIAPLLQGSPAEVASGPSTREVAARAIKADE